ncbi:hypothetical protein HY643_02410 [Candidatus Woesearchaeota archaeon]|nr:hypothetical protein [Candidatus Woesearchaeota archaeon]
MGLEKVFGTAEKPVEEKKLQVIASEEAAIKDWQDYFDKTKEYLPDFFKLKEYFEESLKFLQTFRIQPTLINRFNENNKFHVSILEMVRHGFWGVFFSSLIQTSYDQGFNNFEFEEVQAWQFGNYLKGKEEDKIRIKAEKINGEFVFGIAENFSLTAKKIEGGNIVHSAKNCHLIAEEINGYNALCFAENCVAEITNYQGRAFGHGMKNCKIYAPHKDILAKIKKETKHSGVNNSFYISKLQKEKLD